MAARTEAYVEPDVLIWARTSAGLTIDEAARRLQVKPAKLIGWEEGATRPSLSQLRKMVPLYRRLLSDFFLSRPPAEAPLPHDFRRQPGEVAQTYSRALRVQLRQSRERRMLALDLAAEMEFMAPDIALRVRIDDDPEATGAAVRDLLGITLEAQRQWRDARKSYNAWRSAIEKTGVLVFQVGNIALHEILGYSLSEHPLPVIGVNRKLPPNGRTFTLLHEFVHLLLGTSSICDIEEEAARPPEEQRPEVYCNAVAAAALVPLQALLAQPSVAAAPQRRDWLDDDLDVLGRTFGVSREVVLRRLLTAGRTTNAFYRARRAAWRRWFEAPPPAEAEEEEREFRRNMPREVVSDLGRTFTSLVLDSYLNSQMSLSDVSRYLGLRAEQVAKVRDLIAAP